MRSIIITCVILTAAIIGLAAKYFDTLSGKDNQVTKVLNFIPSDAALILSFKNDEAFYDIFKDFELFDILIGETKQREIRAIREDLLMQSPLSEALTDNNIFLSLHTSPDSVEFLYSLNLNNEYSSDEIVELIREIPDISIKPLSANLFVIEKKSLNKPLYTLIHQGLAIASTSKALIERSIETKTPKLSKQIIEEINKTSSKNYNSPINLFINHDAAPSFLSHFMRGKLNGTSSLLINLKGFSSLSMNFKSDALMFNGISNIDSLTMNYLNLFLHQTAVQNHIKTVLPKNTANFIAFGLSDPPRFRADMQHYLKSKGHLNQLESQLKTIRETTGIDLRRDVSPLFDKEFVVIENAYREKFAIIKVTNGRNLNFKLQLISNAVNESVSQLNYSNIFYYYFGDPLKPFIKPYFGVVDNYLIVANTPGIIRNYISQYENEGLLANSDAFRQFDQLVANRSNILYFVNQRNSKNIIRSMLKPGYSEALGSDRFGKTYGLSYQWTSEGDHFFTNLYLSHNSSDSLALNQ